MGKLVARILNKVFYLSFSLLKLHVICDMFINNYQQFKVKAVLKQFKKTGTSFYLGRHFQIKSPQYISFGDNFSASQRFRIEAWDKYGEQIFTPKIEIGNNVSFNTDIHIGCINHISIGNNVLGASRIYITDHHHGEPTPEMLLIPPAQRPLISKGPVIIKDNVWIGEGVAIMPGVTIGENCIIATNAVVTKDIPANSVAAGIPAKVIKTMIN